MLYWCFILGVPYIRTRTSTWGLPTEGIYSRRWAISDPSSASVLTTLFLFSLASMPPKSSKAVVAKPVNTHEAHGYEFFGP